MTSKCFRYSILMQFEDIKDMVDLLSPAEKEKLRSHLGGKKTTKSELPTDDWLLDGIITHLNDIGLPTSAYALTRLQAWNIYQKKAPPVVSLLEKSAPKLSQIEMRSLGLLVARSLGKRIAVFAQVEARTMLRFIDQAPEALNRSYPGYLANGWISLLVKRNTKHGGRIPGPRLPAGRERSEG